MLVQSQALALPRGERGSLSLPPSLLRKMATVAEQPCGQR